MCHPLDPKIALNVGVIGEFTVKHTWAVRYDDIHRVTIQNTVLYRLYCVANYTLYCIFFCHLDDSLRSSAQQGVRAGDLHEGNTKDTEPDTEQDNSKQESYKQRQKKQLVPKRGATSKTEQKTVL